MKIRASTEKILDLCQRSGLEVSLASHRFRFKSCPNCGTEKWKLWLYEKTLAGSCFRCHTAFNLFSLFKAHGLPVAEVAKLADVPIFDSEVQSQFTLAEEPQKESERPKTPDLGLPRNRYFRIDEWPSHPASKYALSRGVPEDLFDSILIDTQSNSVCFLVFKDGNLAGYQLRYVNPVQEKTFTAPDFQTRDHVLEYRQPNGEGELFVCEGPFNAATAYHWGHTGLCTFGSNISPYHVDYLCNLAKEMNKPLCCAFDMDAPGWHAYLQLKETASMRGVKVRKVEPEAGNDLNDSWKAGKKYKFVECEATSLLQYLPDL
jgi:hypothetical protein